MTRNVRVYELARQLDVTSKDVLTVLQTELKLDISNHMSTINDQVAHRVRDIIKGGADGGAPAGKAAPSQARKPSRPAPAARSGGRQTRERRPDSRPRGDQAGGAQRPRPSGSRPEGRRPAAGRGAPRTDQSPGRGRPAASARPGGGRPAAGGRPGGGRPAAGGRPSGGGRPGGGRPGGGRPGGGRPRGRPGGGVMTGRPRSAMGGPGRRRRPARRRRRAAASHNGRTDSRTMGRETAVTEIVLTGPLAVGELADRLQMPVNQVIQALLGQGVLANINQQIDVDTAKAVAEAFDVAVVEEAEEDDVLDLAAEAAAEADPERMAARPPVVTVLGHVDHGKTTLLDAIRQTQVTKEEAGGITQHIGASVVDHGGRSMVFLDTPGHEAFTAMRARGARLTDVAVLVVAADDGVMPQTIEAVSHAKAAEVPIIVAVNKVDRPEANVDRVKQQLTDIDLIPEDWGGETVTVEVSALQRQGIDDLLEMILLVADIQELEADPEVRAAGIVLEAELDRGRGPVATVLVQQGTLRVGDTFVAGAAWGRVRAMLDHQGQNVAEAGPSIPVSVLGFSQVPPAGEAFVVVEDEKTARTRAAALQEGRREDDMATARVVSLEEFQRRARRGDDRDLRVVVKADVQGSLEALRSSIEQVGTDAIRVQVVHAGVGGITESDVMLASASEGIIVGFNVRPDAGARRLAESEQVEIRTYRVIYDVIDDVRQALEGLLAPDVREKVIGQAEVRQVFKVPGAGMVAGSYVTEGNILRSAQVRVIRDGILIHEGRIGSLRRFKDDVREVRSGFECGIGIERFDDVKEGDILEAFIHEEVKRTLDG